MRRHRTPKEVLLVAAAAVAIAAVVCGCPLGLVMNAQMGQMMGDDMGSQSFDGMCPMLCGVPSSAPHIESDGFVLGPLPAYLALNPASQARPIFHPPTLA